MVRNSDLDDMNSIPLQDVSLISSKRVMVTVAGSDASYVWIAYIRAIFDLNKQPADRGLPDIIWANSEQFSIVEVLTNCVMHCRLYSVPLVIYITTDLVW